MEKKGLYESNWVRLKALSSAECEQCEIAQAYGCRAVRHHRRGTRGWAAMLGGGIIEMYDTKEEAIKRAVCAAMVMDQVESEPSKTHTPLARVKGSGSSSTSGHQVHMLSPKQGAGGKSTTPSSAPLGGFSTSVPGQRPDTKAPTSSVAKNVESAPAGMRTAVERHGFNLTKIRPLKSSCGRFKRYVELVHRNSLDIICCFRGSTDAAQAFGMEPKDIVKACQNDSKRHDKFFGAYMLRYGGYPNDPITAYEYGSHKEDYYDEAEESNNESNDDRLARWKATFSVEKARSSGQGGTGGGASSDKSSTWTSSREDKANTRTSPTFDEIPLEMGNIGGNTAVVDGSVTLRNPPLNPRDSYCIICQEEKAQIIFEPCFHCVICATCSSKGHCSKFCPTCRISITSTVQPKYARFVRPQIFSAYSLM